MKLLLRDSSNYSAAEIMKLKVANKWLRKHKERQVKASCHYVMMMRSRTKTAEDLRKIDDVISTAIR